MPSVTLGKVEASAYDRARGPLPALRFSFDAPVAHGAVLRQLGAPGSWSSAGSPAELLSPIVRRAAEEARRIASEEQEEEQATAPEAQRPRDA